MHYFSAPAGAGKTRSIAERAHRLASKGCKVAIVQISCQLIDATYEQETKRVADGSYTVTVLHSQDGNEESVKGRLIAYWNEAPRRKTGEVVLITHKSFIDCAEAWHRRDLWHVIIDEAPTVVGEHELLLDETHSIITTCLQAEKFDARYVSITPQKGRKAELERIAKNERHDSLLEVLQDFASSILHKHTRTFAIADQWHNLVNGRKSDDLDRSKLVAFVELMPSIVRGFRSVTICGALFESEVIYKLWAQHGVVWVPVSKRMFDGLRYTAHANGEAATIYYAVTRGWSKRLRDAKFEGDDLTILDQIKFHTEELFGEEPFVHGANKDIEGDGLWSTGRKTVQVPHTPHGLNTFQDYHNCVLLAAKNPKPHHFAFLKSRGIDGDELKTAIYRNACYQAVMRISLRNPEDETPKRVVVMDLETAQYLGELFPGAAVEPLPGMRLPPIEATNGRPKKHATDSARVAAHRDRVIREHIDRVNSIKINQLCWIENEGTDWAWEECINAEQILSLADEEAADRVAGGAGKNGSVNCNESTSLYSSFVTDNVPGFAEDLFGEFISQKASDIRFMLYPAIDTNKAIGGITYGGPDVFSKWLAGQAKRVIYDKGDAKAILTTTCSARPGVKSQIGLANIDYIHGLWVDCDDGREFSSDDFASCFPYLRIMAHSTYSTSIEIPRWRAFIPTDLAFDIEVYHVLIDQLLEALNRAGWFTDKQIEEHEKRQTSSKIKMKPGKARKRHGFDMGKFTGQSRFFLPCTPAHAPELAWYRDYGSSPGEELRKPLAVIRELEQCILEFVEPEPVQPVTPTVFEPKTNGISPDLQLAQWLLKQKPQYEGYDLRAVEQATQDWRLTPKGKGNAEYFRFAARLHKLGMPDAEIEQLLRDEAGMSGSCGADRRKEIPRIMSKLGCSGTSRPTNYRRPR